MKETGIKIKAFIYNFFQKTLEKIKKIQLPSIKQIYLFFIKWWHLTVALIFASIVLYYPVGAILTHKIDIDTSFNTKDKPTQIQSLQTLNALIDKQINKSTFTPNLPIIFPSYVLDNMPAFQTGVVQGVQKVVFIFSAINPESDKLKQSAENFLYPADIWHIQSWKPALSSTKIYNQANALVSDYISDIETKQAIFNTSKTALKTFLSDLSVLLENQALLLEKSTLSTENTLFDSKADDTFYQAKGNIYAFYLALRDIKSDFKDITENKALLEKYSIALSFLEKALDLSPVVVSNGKPETQFMPNHLLSLGYYLSQSALNLQHAEKGL